MARVELTDDSRDDFEDLDQSARMVVAKGLKKLETSPELRGAPLGNRASGDLTGLRKLVCGPQAYRIVYRVESDGTVCVVFVIGKRADSEVYDIAVARLQTLGAQGMAEELQAAMNQVFQRNQSNKP